MNSHEPGAVRKRPAQADAAREVLTPSRPPGPLRAWLGGVIGPSAISKGKEPMAEALARRVFMNRC